MHERQFDTRLMLDHSGGRQGSITMLPKATSHPYLLPVCLSHYYLEPSMGQERHALHCHVSTVGFDMTTQSHPVGRETRYFSATYLVPRLRLYSCKSPSIESSGGLEILVTIQSCGKSKHTHEICVAAYFDQSSAKQAKHLHCAADVLSSCWLE